MSLINDNNEQIKPKTFFIYFNYIIQDDSNDKKYFDIIITPEILKPECPDYGEWGPSNYNFVYIEDHQKERIIRITDEGILISLDKSRIYKSSNSAYFFSVIKIYFVEDGTKTFINPEDDFIPIARRLQRVKSIINEKEEINDDE